MSLINIENLKTQYELEEGKVHAVDGVSFEIETGEALGLVGESGCGKSTLAKSLMRILPDNGEVTEGNINFDGDSILDYSNSEFRKKIRWQKLSMIPQEAMNGFDPVYTVGEQIVQIIKIHEDTSSEEAWERTYELFDDLGLEPSRADDYPHEFSGGMAQRAMIAYALILDPDLIIADEPTTALDVIIQNKILKLLRGLQDDLDTSIILITHDISVVSEACDKIAVMYGGRIVEFADTDTVLKNPRHPYTLGLKNAFPSMIKDSQELISIPGNPPTLINPEEGCKFAPRCPFAEEECWEITPEPEEYDDGHIVECHRADEMDELKEDATVRSTWKEVES